MQSTAKPLALSALSPLEGDKRAWSTSLIYGETVDGKTCLHIPPAIEPARHLEDIVDLTLELLALQPAQRTSEDQSTFPFDAKLDKRLQRALWLTPAQLNEHFPKHQFHPYVALFMKCADQERLFDYRMLRQALSKAERDQYAAARQRMLAAMRAGAGERNFRKRLKAHNDKVKRNLRVIRKYTDSQFRDSRVLVIRVDCKFVEGFAPGHDWLEARRYREALIKYLNKNLPKAIQPARARAAREKLKPISGYIIGTEYGVETGWHFHVTLFLNGNDFDNGVGIASLICWTWRDKITGGNGRYYNCNQAAKDGVYGTQDGVGVIRRDDPVKRAILRDVVTSYAGKGCYYAEAQTGTKDRLLNKGAWPTAKDPKKGGRPEKPTQPQSVVLTQVFSEKTKRFAPIWRPSEAAQPQVSY